MIRDFAVVGIFLLGAAAFVLITLLINWFVSPKKPSEMKKKTYECGLEPKGETWIQFKIYYFLYGLMFVVFDIETVFLYPWAVKFMSMGMFAFIEMIIFMTILVFALWYAWKKGALEWH